MNAPQRKKFHYSIENYLTIERAAEERHEFLDGEIYAMAGESPEHGDVSANLMGLLVPQLKETSCRVRTKDTKVLSGPTLRTTNVSRIMFSVSGRRGDLRGTSILRRAS